jgi:hypothetical protein
MAEVDQQSMLKLIGNLKIIPVRDDSPIPAPPFVPFVAIFNPDSFTIKEDLDYTTHCTPAKDGGGLVFRGTKPREFTMEFMLDGTGVNMNGVKIPVTAQVALFRTTTSLIVGEKHRPPRLLVQYGTFINFCRLKSSSINYTMFDVAGLPIRAKVTASFVEEKDPYVSDLFNMLSSPDLTHIREVREKGELLPMICHEIYENQNYYIQIAKVNRLKNFRKLKAEIQLVMPPFGS